MPISMKHTSYIEHAESRLADMRTKLLNVKTRIDAALVHHRIGYSEQLCKAVVQAETHLGDSESRLEQIKKAKHDSSEETIRAFDRSSDEAARSIKNVVHRFS